jgi:hypothetical protein
MYGTGTTPAIDDGQPSAESHIAPACTQSSPSCQNDLIKLKFPGTILEKMK